jgi:hypothetical protein
MNIKLLIFNFVPSLLFFSALLSLSLSSLTITKIIDLQTDLLLSFFSETVESDVMGGLKLFLLSVWENVLIPIIPCLLLATISICWIITQQEYFNKRLFILSWLTLMPLLFFLTNSIPIVFGYFGCLITGILTTTDEEPSFSLGFYGVSSKLRIFYVFLIVGLFVTMYLNFNVYKERIKDSNLRLLVSFVPDVNKLQGVQRKQLESFVEQTGEGFKSSITNQYNTLPQDVQQQCKPLYDSIITGIDNYKEEAIQKIRVKEYEVSEEEIKNMVLQAFPAFEGIIKATPLTTAILAFTFLEVLRFVFGVIGGLAAFLASKFKD